jgi:hypothetical protein
LIQNFKLFQFLSAWFWLDLFEENAVLAQSCLLNISTAKFLLSFRPNSEWVRSLRCGLWAIWHCLLWFTVHEFLVQMIINILISNVWSTLSPSFVQLWLYRAPMLSYFPCVLDLAFTFVNNFLEWFITWLAHHAGLHIRFHELTLAHHFWASFKTSVSYGPLREYDRRWDASRFLSGWTTKRMSKWMSLTQYLTWIGFVICLKCIWGIVWGI